VYARDRSFAAAAGVGAGPSGSIALAGDVRRSVNRTPWGEPSIYHFRSDPSIVRSSSAHQALWHPSTVVEHAAHFDQIIDVDLDDSTCSSVPN
jgi:hypothetical protein